MLCNRPLTCAVWPKCQTLFQKASSGQVVGKTDTGYTAPASKGSSTAKPSKPESTPPSSVADVKMDRLSTIITDAIINLAGPKALLPVSDPTQVQSISGVLASKLDVTCEVSNMILE